MTTKIRCAGYREKGSPKRFSKRFSNDKRVGGSASAFRLRGRSAVRGLVSAHASCRVASCRVVSLDFTSDPQGKPNKTSCMPRAGSLERVFVWASETERSEARPLGFETSPSPFAYALRAMHL